MRPSLQTVVRGPDGAVAPGASVRVLIRGTAFEYATYAAASGGSALTQPLTADSAGRISVFPATGGQFDIQTTVNGIVTTQPVDLHATGIDGWTTATMTNGFVAAAGFQAPAYKRDSDGVVYLRGAIGQGTGVIATSAFQMPSGYRPTVGRRRFLAPSFGSWQRLDVGTGGTVLPQGGAGVWFLDGIRFMP